VLLDWRTNYPDYRHSNIFKLSDRIFSSQQEQSFPDGVCWDYYFPYNPFVAGKNEHSFIPFLRYSMYRPRDIISMLSILQENIKKQNRATDDTVKLRDFECSEFQTKYSDYLLGEIKDYLSFYYSDHDYELFLKFFEFLGGRKEFKYSEYLTAFNNYNDYIIRNNISNPKFSETADIFLQFLYDLNILCFIENTRHDKFIRWCFRERNYSNLSPKVKTDVDYMIHHGLIKGLNLGKKIIKGQHKKKWKVYNKK
jgi:hypothetical protein